ncbi:unnamed protein product [Phytophthora fragariaefolia]|uniref:Unnamed protein product n=1 Tax=Phytophthora fragariaefolia TaxID=1490495 RepID=A0A9W6Y0P8_9STRA|nr:unnamed protein product [Phytophthora fragariaefolia]
MGPDLSRLVSTLIGNFVNGVKYPSMTRYHEDGTSADQIDMGTGFRFEDDTKKMVQVPIRSTRCNPRSPTGTQGEKTPSAPTDDRSTPSVVGSLGHLCASLDRVSNFADPAPPQRNPKKAGDPEGTRQDLISMEGVTNDLVTDVSPSRGTGLRKMRKGGGRADIPAKYRGFQGSGDRGSDKIGELK